MVYYNINNPREKSYTGVPTSYQVTCRLGQSIYKKCKCLPIQKEQSTCLNAKMCIMLRKDLWMVTLPKLKDTMLCYLLKGD